MRTRFSMPYIILTFGLVGMGLFASLGRAEPLPSIQIPQSKNSTAKFYFDIERKLHLRIEVPPEFTRVSFDSIDGKHFDLPVQANKRAKNTKNGFVDIVLSEAELNSISNKATIKLNMTEHKSAGATLYPLAALAIGNYFFDGTSLVEPPKLPTLSGGHSTYFTLAANFQAADEIADSIKYYAGKDASWTLRPDMATAGIMLVPAMVIRAFSPKGFGKLAGVMFVAASTNAFTKEFNTLTGIVQNSIVGETEHEWVGHVGATVANSAVVGSFYYFGRDLLETGGFMAEWNLGLTIGAIYSLQKAGASGLSQLFDSEFLGNTTTGVIFIVAASGIIAITPADPALLDLWKTVFQYLVEAGTFSLADSMHEGAKIAAKKWLPENDYYAPDIASHALWFIVAHQMLGFARGQRDVNVKMAAKKVADAFIMASAFNIVAGVLSDLSSYLFGKSSTVSYALEE